MKLLLEDGRADPRSADGLLLQAVQEGRIQIVSLLLEDGRIDPSSDDNAALKLALQLRQYRIASLLLSDSRVIGRRSNRSIASVSTSIQRSALPSLILHLFVHSRAPKVEDMQQSRSLISALMSVDRHASAILEQAYAGEKDLLLYLTSPSCHEEVRLNPCYEDAGYQAYLLHCTVISGPPEAYVTQYKKYKAWLASQNDSPSFYWNSPYISGSPPLNMISSSYADYLSRTESVSLIKKIREEMYDSANWTNSGYKPQETPEVLTPDPEATKKKEEESWLCTISAEIARMKLCPDKTTGSHRFGTIGSIEHSLLYTEARKCTSQDQVRKILCQYFPCLAPAMNTELHNSIIEELVIGATDPKVMLGALHKYEAILRDMMEEEGTKRIADLYGIGMRSCKKFNLLPMKNETMCDVLNTERMSLRFLQMKYNLRREQDVLKICYDRYMFLEKEYNALLNLGAVDEYNYNSKKLKMAHAILAYTSNPEDQELKLEMIRRIDRMSCYLTIGIDECLKSIGTDRIALVRLIRFEEREDE